MSIVFWEILSRVGKILPHNTLFYAFSLPFFRHIYRKVLQNRKASCIIRVKLSFQPRKKFKSPPFAERRFGFRGVFVFSGKGRQPPYSHEYGRFSVFISQQNIPETDMSKNTQKVPRHAVRLSAFRIIIDKGDPRFEKQRRDCTAV